MSVHNNGQLEASMQFCSKGVRRALHYGKFNGYVDASMQVYIKSSVGPLFRSIIMGR
jgi:hypothetical protein